MVDTDRLNREIAEIYGIGSWHLDLGSNTLFWSERTRQIHEVPDSYVPSVEKAIDFYAPVVRPILINAIETAIQNGAGWDLELPFITAKGRSIWVRAVGRVIVEDGQPVALLGAFEDISGSRKQSAALRAMFDNFPGGIIQYDRNHVLRAYNSELAALLDLPEDLLENTPTMLDIMRFSARRGDFGPGDPDRLVAQHAALLTSGEPVTYERHMPDGAVLEVRSMPQPDGGIVAILSDVTMQRRLTDLLENQARHAQDRLVELQVIIASMTQGVSVFNELGELIVWNQQYIDLFDKPVSEVCFKTTLRELVRAEQRRGEFDGDVDQHVQDLTARLRRGEVVETKIAHRSGKVISSVHTPLPNGGWIGTHEDVTEREREIGRIQFAANHDMLTKLANRAFFSIELDRFLERERLEEETAYLMLLDLDEFKPVNDSYGHAAGDVVLKEVAARLKRLVRVSDVVARFGGDEFGILLLDVRSKDYVTEIAQRIIADVKAPYRYQKAMLRISASIGITRIDPEDTDRDAILKRADKALYAAKDAGRDRFMAAS